MTPAAMTTMTNKTGMVRHPCHDTPARVACAVLSAFNPKSPVDGVVPSAYKYV